MTSGAGMHPRHDWVRLLVEGQITELLYGLGRVRTGGRHYVVSVDDDDQVVFRGDDGARYLVEFEVRATALPPVVAEHVLSEPRPSRKPDARGWFEVACSCGYVSSPRPRPERAQRAAEDHVRSKVAEVQDDDQDHDAETTEALREAAATRVRITLELITNSLGHGYAAVLDEAVHELEVIAARTGRVFSPSERSSSIPPSIVIDTCRHQHSTGGVAPRRSEGPRSRPGH